MDKRLLGGGVLSALLLTAALTIGGGAAHADAGSYTPDEPKQPSLAGSKTAAICIDDEPWISYTVTLNDPDHTVTTDSAKLTITDGRHRISIGLGTLKDGALTGSVLWPGADTNSDGAADSWPGWVYDDGSWVATDGNFRWTRGSIRAYIDVNPEIEVPLSYPAATSSCAGPSGEVAGSVRTVSQDGDVLARTGGTTGTLVAAGAVGGILLLAGVGLSRRRRKHGA